ncbi:hypothetical protein MON38_04005 [Hymenobacter sp. DH14]|uniref:Uncharacterized protein n=1 Tax=Hymenobacter cyanobacteriorum TaxID=2926463 RepID=A0A9X1VCE1_9BACT|nr:hypothetical protein [Hymenobacter cyanobacteriorum]MCI1186569.1 hypothetical protein [Hymenobacter cyanobacteriorum]
MNKLIHTAPPSQLGRWLTRSVAWTLACTMGFVPVFYWVVNPNSGGKGSKFLSLILLTSVQILAWKKGVADFSLAYHSNCPAVEMGLKVAALSWLTLLISTLVWTTLMCAYGWLLWTVRY